MISWTRDKQKSCDEILLQDGYDPSALFGRIHLGGNLKGCRILSWWGDIKDSSAPSPMRCTSRILTSFAYYTILDPISVLSNIHHKRQVNICRVRGNTLIGSQTMAIGRAFIWRSTTLPINAATIVIMGTHTTDPGGPIITAFGSCASLVPIGTRS